MQAHYVQIHPDDTVIVTLRPYAKGEILSINRTEITVLEDVPAGHKIAIRNHAPGEDIIKYGYPIGAATTEIKQGAWVHTHNVQTKLEGTLEYRYNPKSPQKHPAEGEQAAGLSFSGYVRKNGDVGIRNEIWIINTVGCINKTAERLAAIANQRFQAAYLDGVFHFPHPYGCSQLGDDLSYTQKILGSLVQHPNAAGVLVLGLGCENNYIDLFKSTIPDLDEERVKFMSVQEVEDELETGLDLIADLVVYARQFKRETVPLSKLKIGLKCGGSDGFSGVTANPLTGAVSDMVIQHGGTSILTEVPEMFGAEQILMDRATNERVFEKLVHVINGFKAYFMKYGQPIYENPSPGNKKGGITTLEEKSLGCVQKGGFAPVVDVLPYGSRVSKPGLNIVQGPGNDLVSVTALAAAGAHMVLFTTGRGTPFGGPVPTVKIATNSSLYSRKKHWIDYNAGCLLEGSRMEEVKQDLFSYLLKVASGEVKTKNEQYGFREIAIFKDGVTL
ncbi:D-galactarate dehydratase/Altronate hydrolase domain protein [Caldalkalibacillus thermarum TA2.A1]|uniref:Altronate dehydratase family protein n=1 Tax=Caldalkalibacillus thermarum (strain TA2.A1) TaxID=986075 RepID=F5LAT3_CALTT|nr:altronate dehydratase family protein [Caldalkalibacillus thermarum]EGL81472.1 D-galactarate dehydratase/Altronate hydrolase domain protein [Caldalkalibacillus thermarum TA2.A1]QZT33779.1 altronate dehydratase family protein [Caldalkalibacillus thermarum TA2.A1]